MSTLITDPREAAFRAFLDAHLDQELLRFTTAGSVDDGKSTLIGRLLHDTRSVYEDQLAAVRASRVNRAGNGQVDLSLLTDGLRAEREQGITIDVAYRYFSTSKRKFIIADTPGHEQYTRNMATGASTADVAIVLIDAAAFVKADGLLPQSRRHTNIASLLRIPHVVAAVNKMDLVGYSAEVFDRIAAEFTKLSAELQLESVALVPVSALAGDNVVDPSKNMPWYTGPTLLEYLETVQLQVRDESQQPLRFPVQLVVRPDANFRGFAGRIERGELRAGLSVRALPSGRVTKVKSIVTYDGELKSAASPRSVTVELEDEIDLSRGEMLIAENETAPLVTNRIRAMLVWMLEQPLELGTNYLLKHTTRTVRATVRAIRHRIDVNTGERLAATKLNLNDIAEVELETSLPLFFDPYAESRAMGSFILIDPVTNATVGAAMIVAAADETSGSEPTASLRRFAFVHLSGDDAAARATALRESLLAIGRNAIIVDDAKISPSSLPSVARALELAGVIGISAREQLDEVSLVALRESAGEAFFTDEVAATHWIQATE
ncbi:sulfate adenylyltransferase subunit 1 [Bryocella elongata]|uniref:Sulfate adenylyltransferase subunit 1 n=1 Tax=Bryocella elongata TaxID=863522 RepID=A0A1H5WN62_9BACT|nr:sulfate adenylyltransferase subunit CysN [Bryocella elongata]SEG00902.1 sulfate adenylyltransferase subunit 1 [Bryocella elongata]